MQPLPQDTQTDLSGRHILHQIHDTVVAEEVRRFQRRRLQTLAEGIAVLQGHAEQVARAPDRPGGGLDQRQAVRIGLRVGERGEGSSELVVCADRAAIIERYGLDEDLVFGDFIGRLDGSGERLELANDVGIPLQSVRYSDEGKWPTAPDGTGHSLVIRGVHLDSKEPESWTWSPELGGSPGRANFPEETGPRFDEAVLIDLGDTWRWRRGTEAFSAPPDAWRSAGFDDSGWETGVTGFGYGDDDDATVLDDMRDGYTSVAIRKVVEVSAAELAAPGDYFLGMTFDDGFCAFVNGRLVAQDNCEAGFAFDDTADGSHEARDEELFLLQPGALVEGENLVAIVGHNFTVRSSDFSLAPRLLKRSLVIDEEGGRGGLSLNELYRGASPGTGWAELFNHSSTAVDLSGHRLTDHPAREDAFTFAQGTSVPPGGFLVVTEAEGGFDFAGTEARLFLLTFRLQKPLPKAPIR